MLCYNIIKLNIITSILFIEIVTKFLVIVILYLTIVTYV